MFAQLIYTGISRASQFTLIINNGHFVSQEAKSINTFELSDEAKKEFGDDKRKMIEKALEGKDLKKSETTNPPTPTPTPPTPPTPPVPTSTPEPNT